MTDSAGWYDDPTGSGDFRFWDGEGWTGEVGITGAPGTAAVWAPDPAGGRYLRFWDGRKWTELVLEVGSDPRAPRRAAVPEPGVEPPPHEAAPASFAPPPPPPTPITVDQVIPPPFPTPTTVPPPGPPPDASPPAEPVSAGEPDADARSGGRRRWIVPAAAVSAVVVVGVGALLLTRGDDSEPGSSTDPTEAAIDACESSVGQQYPPPAKVTFEDDPEVADTDDGWTVTGAFTADGEPGSMPYECRLRRGADGKPELSALSLG